MQEAKAYKNAGGTGMVRHGPAFCKIPRAGGAGMVRHGPALCKIPRAEPNNEVGLEVKNVTYQGVSLKRVTFT